MKTAVLPTRIILEKLDRFIRGDATLTSKSYCCRGMVGSISFDNEKSMLTVKVNLPIEETEGHWHPIRRPSRIWEPLLLLKVKVKKVCLDSDTVLKIATDNTGEHLCLIQGSQPECFAFNDLIDREFAPEPPKVTAQ